MELNICPDYVKTKNGIKRDRRLIRTKKAIIMALLQLLSHKELSAITVTELSECAGINRKTFYLHYDRVEDVIEDFGEDILSYTDTVVRRHIEQNGKIDIGVLFEALNSTIMDNLEFFRIFVRSGAYHIFISASMRSEYIRNLRASIELYLRGGVLLSPYIMEFLVSGVTAMYIKWLGTDLPTESLDDLSQTAAALVAAALGQSEVKADEH